MNKSINLTITLLAAGLLLGAGTAQAAKVPKVDVCHLDADAGIFYLNSVGAQALESHLNHGDLLPGVDNGDNAINLDEDCMLVTPARILARAFIDVVDDGGPYDAERDIDIAILRDTSGDQMVSEGDEVELDAFPTAFNPCSAPGTCEMVGSMDANKVSTVLTVTPSLTPDTTIIVRTDAQIVVVFTHSLAGESIQISNDAVVKYSVFLSDTFSTVTPCLLGDSILAQQESFVSPAPVVSPTLVNPNCANEPFLDVELTHLP